MLLVYLGYLEMGSKLKPGGTSCVFLTSSILKQTAEVLYFGRSYFKKKTFLISVTVIFRFFRAMVPLTEYRARFWIEDFVLFFFSRFIENNCVVSFCSSSYIRWEVGGVVACEVLSTCQVVVLHVFTLVPPSPPLSYVNCIHAFLAGGRSCQQLPACITALHDKNTTNLIPYQLVLHLKGYRNDHLAFRYNHKYCPKIEFVNNM